jgi:ubiquitin C-terminal hydrolase
MSACDPSNVPTAPAPTVSSVPHQTVEERDLMEPLGLPNLGNTCFSNAAIQAFISCTKKQILANSYQPQSILFLLKTLLVSKNQESKIDFINKVFSQSICSIGQQSDSLYFFENFLKTMKQDDPTLFSNFIFKHQLTTYYCGNIKYEEDKSKFNLYNIAYKLQLK